MKACPHHTVSRAWCYDHYVSKLTLCDLGLYHMYTSICVLMYLYYIYLLISAMMDLLSDEVPLIFYERLRRQILSKVGDRFAYGMGCWMWLSEKKIGKMDPLALYQIRILIRLTTCLPTSQHHALSAQAAWLVRILQTVRSWAVTSIDHPNHLIILEYWSFRCKNNWFELCMGNETS